jgi:dephospho-CoA kinase
MLRVGLTGNIGMGKTTVLGMFGELGAFTVNADEIVRDLLAEEAVLKRLRPLLGDDAFDTEGRLAKAKASEKVFGDASVRRAVEDVLHPLVFERVEGLLEGAEAEIAVVEAPVIFERGHEGRFDRTITVYTDEETALARLDAMGVPREESLRRLGSQMPIEEKTKRADFAIDNSGTAEETRAKVRRVYRALQEEAAG